MTESEWLACGEPDLMLEQLEGRVSRPGLVDFVRRCWEHVARHLPDVPTGVTAADEYAALAPTLSDHDAVVYASEATLKAAGWAPDRKAEQRWQSAVLRRIAGESFRSRVG